MMKKTQVAAAVALALSSASFAQQAVQWKVSDGGNGHWYQSIRPSPIPTTFAEQDAFSASRGAVMATMSTSQENDFVVSIMGTAASEHNGAMFGLRREPNGSWAWCDQTPLDFTAWGGWNCGSGPYPNNSTMTGEMCGHLYLQDCGWIWDDTPPSWSPVYTNLRLLIEWSADCNNDGIVDYGQCRDGTLPDYNGNNIPDCCERGEACVVSDYPMRWRVEDGGNGHWYKLLHVLPSESAEQHFIRAHEAGGYTATISSAEENRVCFGIANNAPIAVLIGIRKQAGNNIPEWITGEPWAYSNWHSGEGSNSSERYADYVPEWGGQWQDTDTTPQQYSIIEWSADCNNDGVVDYGQILTGQLADTNSNGVPDACEVVTCREADFFPDRNVNGADLGILLSQWGPATQYTVADLNRDGTVDGADLGIILSFWGPCPY